MTFPLEYHETMRRLIPASLAVFGMFSLPLLLASNSPAQIGGASATAAHGFTGSTASVSSPGHSNSFGTNSSVHASPRTPSTHGPRINHGNAPRRSVNGTAYYPYLYAVPVPYAIDPNASIYDNDEDETDYQGGPTIFDRRGSGPYSYVPPSTPSPTEAQNQQSEDPPPPAVSNDPGPATDPTILVFKDGHQIEVANYAIVSQTLYDLTPGHPRKIALADLDLRATEKQNDDHGVTFQLPPSAQAN
jgi:hypothetical protein